MGGEDRTATMEELLAQTGWLQRLALRLAGDADAAEDAVQETWMAAVRHSPETDEPVRPWLAKVLRNALRMRARSERRRAAREQDAHLLQDDVPTPETRGRDRGLVHRRLAFAFGRPAPARRAGRRDRGGRRAGRDRAR